MARLLLVLAALSVAAPRASGADVSVTCADKAAAGFTEACVVPYNFPAGAAVLMDDGSTPPLPTEWLGAPPVCYTQYFQNQLATPTFMPRNSTCSAYANRGCCSSETVRRCVLGARADRAGGIAAAAFKTLRLTTGRGRAAAAPRCLAPRSIDNLDYLLNLYPGYSLYRCGGAGARARGRLGRGAAAAGLWRGRCADR